MADEKPQTVTVQADQPHTYAGASYEPGDVYEIEIKLLDTIQAQRKAHLVTAPAKATARKPKKTSRAPRQPARGRAAKKK